MKNIKLVSLLTLLAFATSSFASVKIKDLKLLSKKNGSAQVSINFTGELKSTPEVSVRDNIVQVAIPQAQVWPKIEKKVSINSKFDSTLTAYQFDKSVTRFRALVPYSLKGSEAAISLTIKDNKIQVDFPIVSSNKVVGKKVAKAKKVNTRKPAVVKNVKAPKAKVSDYDESYLKTLLADKKKNVKEEPLFPADKNEEDKVEMALSGVEKNSIKDMPMLEMIAKFAGSLIAIIGVFFLIVGALKRGVLKKGKLGFLNNTDVVTVLNTTYIGPKKSLMLVKVHKQVFLISNDEKGMHFLSEVSDTTGILKDGEQAISGTNFDATLDVAEVASKDFKLKEAPTYSPSTPAATITPSAPITTEESNSSDSLANFLDNNPITEQVKLSDQIKDKVKGLKALQ